MKHTKTSLRQVTEGLVQGMEVTVVFNISRESFFLEATSEEEVLVVSEVFRRCSGIANYLPNKYFAITFPVKTVIQHWTNKGSIDREGIERAANKAFREAVRAVKAIRKP